MWLNPQETTDLGTFTEEVLNAKVHFLCSERAQRKIFEIRIQQKTYWKTNRKIR